MLALLISLFASIPPRVQAQTQVERVICTEAGFNIRDETQRLGLWIAFVIDNRVNDLQARMFNETTTREDLITRVLTAKYQWGHNCKVNKIPAWLTVLARHVLEDKLHWRARPKWMTDDIMWVIAASEAKKLGQRWGDKCLAHVELGAAFYRRCE